MDIRLLDNADQAEMEAFLKLHRDSSMFLRANSQRVGLVYQPAALHATYAGAFEKGKLCGVVAHGWNGMIILQCPDSVEEIARECVRLSERRVTGLIGPLDQVRHARVALGLAAAPARMEEDEWLFGLDLSGIIVPAALADGFVICRPPLLEERETLYNWRTAYDIESLGGADSDETRKRASAYLDGQLAQQNVWVAIDGGRLVSLSAFNAALPDIVQLGGIYTPPEYRGRGYAKVSVAGSLITARERGVSRAVLFTSNPSAARSYEGVGFQRLGDYGLIMLQ
jgi:GNAT superfamily N-acetyltransferase